MGSFTQLTYHIVFGTKYRCPTITSDLRERLYEYIGGTIRNKKGSLIEIGGTADHLHVLARLSPTLALSDTIRDIKANSSASARKRSNDRWEWQVGYGAFTVSHSQRGVLTTCIQSQEEHHRQKSFHEEYVELLRKHGIEFRNEHLFEDEHHG